MNLLIILTYFAEIKHNATVMPYQNQNIQFGRSSSKFYRCKCDVYFCTCIRKLNKIITFFPSQQNGKYSIMHKARNGTQQEWALFAVEGIAVWYQSKLSWGEVKEAYGFNPQTKKKSTRGCLQKYQRQHLHKLVTIFKIKKSRQKH